MITSPQCRDFGLTAKFHRSLFKELLQGGYSHPDIFRMSLSEALLARYGSPDVVDEFLGPGTFQGVKQTLGPLVPWRMAWSRVKNQEKTRYLAQVAALDALKGKIAACQDTGVTDLEIWITTQKMLGGHEQGQTPRVDH